MRLLLALALLSPAALAADPQKTLAVLEFHSKLPKDAADVGYLTDVVRTAAKDAVPGLKVITRENLFMLLQATGKKMEDCEGECEVDTGRRVGADLVISGEVLRFGTQFKVTMKLHDTHTSELLGGAQASGATLDELDKNLPVAVAKVLGPLGAKPAAAAPVASKPEEKSPPAPAPVVKSQPAPHATPVEAPSALSPLIAILHFNDKLKDPALDVFYIDDAIRNATLASLKGVRVMTRENQYSLLTSMGKNAEHCEGECEVDTGRLLGADYVISGDVLKFGSSFKVVLKMHETGSGQMLGGTEATGKTVDELGTGLRGAVRELLAPLVEKADAERAAAKAAADKEKAQPPIARAVDAGGAAPKVETQARSTVPMPDPYAGGVWDPKAKSFGEEVGLTFLLTQRVRAAATVVIGPHIGARAAVYYGLGGGVSIGPRLFFEPVPGGTAFGGGAGLRYALNIVSWLSLIGTGAVEAVQTPTSTVIAPLLSVGLQINL